MRSKQQAYLDHVRDEVDRWIELSLPRAREALLDIVDYVTEAYRAADQKLIDQRAQRRAVRAARKLCPVCQDGACETKSMECGK